MMNYKVLGVSHIFNRYRYRKIFSEFHKLFPDQFEIKIIAPATKNFELRRASECPIITLFPIFRKRHTFLIYPNIIKLARLLKKWKPDLIDFSHEVPWGWSLAEIISLKKLVNSHCKVTFLCNINIKREWKGWRFFYKFVENYNFKNADCVYTLIKYPKCENYIREHGYLGKIYYVPHFVDMDLFKPMKKDPKILKQYKVSTSDYVLGIVGGLTKRHGVYIKGTKIVIDLLKSLPSNYKLLIIGPGPGKNKKEIQEYARKKGVLERIRFTGPILPENMPLIYNNLDLVVGFSIPVKDWMEPFGRFVIEAQACKIPIIVSNCGGLPYVVKNKEIVCEELEDKEALKEKILKLERDLKFRERVISYGYRRVKKEFSLPAVASKMKTMYLDILEGKHKNFNFKLPCK